jgi:hypothetical protein
MTQDSVKSADQLIQMRTVRAGAGQHWSALGLDGEQHGRSAPSLYTIWAMHNPVEEKCVEKRIPDCFATLIPKATSVNDLKRTILYMQHPSTVGFSDPGLLHKKNRYI